MTRPTANAAAARPYSPIPGGNGLIIIDPPLTELCDTVDCRYTLIVLAAKRARELVNGSEPFVAAKDPSKTVSIALKEINDGYVSYVREEGSEF